MKKVFFQGIVTVAAFFLTWFLLMQVDWMSVFRVKQVTDKTEEKLGELFWRSFSNQKKSTSIRRYHVLSTPS